MQKTPELYDIRNSNKKILAKKPSDKIIHVGQIWMYKVGVNIGTEISKDAPYMRPCIILANKLGGDLVFIIPLTTKNSGQIYAKKLDNCHLYGLLQDSWYLLNQIKTISIKRLIFKCNDKKSDLGPIIPRIDQASIDTIFVQIFNFLQQKTTAMLDEQSTVDNMSE